MENFYQDSEYACVLWFAIRYFDRATNVSWHKDLQYRSIPEHEDRVPLKHEKRCLFQFTYLTMVMQIYEYVRNYKYYLEKLHGEYSSAGIVNQS